jgi:hypothetical protein
MDDVLLRLHGVLVSSLNGLSDEDRAERIAWCQANGVHGVQAVPAGESTEYHWGGRLLAVVQNEVLTAERDAVIEMTHVAVPDDARQLTDD